MTLSKEHVPMALCVKGRLYQLRCQNLGVGVYDGAGGFIGLRSKYGRWNLDSENHTDMGAPYGTVGEAVDLGVDLPAGIEPVERFPGAFDWRTGRPVRFDTPRSEGGRGWVFEDTDEDCPEGTHGSVRGNKPLYDFLKSYLKVSDED